MKIPYKGCAPAPLPTDKHRENRIMASSVMGRENRTFESRIRSILGSGTEGGALVEMAVTLPLVFLLMTGIFSFSLALYEKLQLAEAVSAGGRVLSVDRGDTDPCTTTTNAIYSAAPSLTQGSLTISYTLGSTVEGKSCSGTTAMTAGANATVTASYPCSLNVYGLKYSTCTMSSQVTEVIQ